jgi:RimJ/RimL family protein N-acetyltransferase
LCVKRILGIWYGEKFASRSIQWADLNGIKKIILNVLETNEKAINLYMKLGFEVEGTLKKDKKLSDGNYYSPILMGRFCK